MKYNLLLTLMNAKGEYPLTADNEAKLIALLQLTSKDLPAAQMTDAAHGYVALSPIDCKRYVLWLIDLVFYSFDCVESLDVRLSIPGDNAAGYSRGLDRFDYVPMFNVAGRIANARRQGASS